jgi:hypothetical protein
MFSRGLYQKPKDLLGDFCHVKYPSVARNQSGKKLGVEIA